jgi:hypothetical protein
MISKVSNFSSPMSKFSKKGGLKGTLTNPGISGVDIYNSGQTNNGWYYIQTSTMSSPKQVYCNMTDEGGGWMLICYTTNFSTVGATQGARYPNVWQNGQGTLNRLSASTMDLWYHNGSSQCTQVMKMASPTASSVPILSNMVIANKVVYTNPENLSLVTYVNDTYTMTSTLALNGVWSPVKGHTLMTGTLSVNAPRDWIYQTNVWWTVCGPSTQLLTDGRSGNAQGSGSWTNPTSNALYGMANVATTTNSLRSDINTYAVFIK